MTYPAHISIKRQSGVAQDPVTGAYSGGAEVDVYTGPCDYQPMDEMKTVHLDGTRLEGVNGRVFTPTAVSVQADDDVTITDEHLDVHTGNVVGVRKYDRSILVRV